MKMKPVFAICWIMRNRLAHGYDSIDLKVLWDKIEDDLPPLIKELEKILDKKTVRGQNFSTCAIRNISYNQAANLNFSFLFSSQDRSSPLRFTEVKAAKASEPLLDQLIPLCFWREETIKSFIFSPIALEFFSLRRLRKA